jgi:hypothetical protein
MGGFADIARRRRSLCDCGPLNLLRLRHPVTLSVVDAEAAHDLDDLLALRSLGDGLRAGEGGQMRDVWTGMRRGTMLIDPRKDGYDNASYQ